MTHDEIRIVEFLITANPTELAHLPDWFLHVIEADDAGGMSRELITAASLLFVRREYPGIGFAAARRLLAEYAADPGKCDELAERINAFRLSCCFERLKRAGIYQDVSIGDPFEPDGLVSVTLTEADWRRLNADHAANGARLGEDARWSMN